MLPSSPQKQRGGRWYLPCLPPFPDSRCHFTKVHKQRDSWTRRRQSGELEKTHKVCVQDAPHLALVWSTRASDGVSPPASIGTKLPRSAASPKKQESSRKTSISALLTMPKPLTVWVTVNCGKF